MSEDSMVELKDLSSQERKDLLEAFLLKEWEMFTSPAAQYLWPWEERRWHELLFCLFFAQACPPLESATVREVIDSLAELSMLEVSELAETAHNWKKEGTYTPYQQTLSFLVQEQGLEKEQTRSVLQSFAEAAAAIQEQYGGKVQRYFRQYGEQMLAEAVKTFQLSELPEDKQHRAFTHWLQNTLNMPLSLREPVVEMLCEDFDLTYQDLQDTADELGLNLALMDDIIANALQVFGTDSIE